MSRFELDYKIALNMVLRHGALIDTRAGEAYTSFGISLHADLSDGFPILTGKKMDFSKIHAEFRWFWQGKTDLKTLHRYGIRYWDQFTDKNGDLGPTYGSQIRYWNRSSVGIVSSIDQIAKVVDEVSSLSRRAVLTFWNPSDIHLITLPPCYVSMTFVRIDKKLHMDFNLRSSDMSVGLPFDICIGALFLTEIANICGLEPGRLKLNLSNAHIYKNNEFAVEEYLASTIHDLPIYNGISELTGYKHGKFIKMELNV